MLPRVGMRCVWLCKWRWPAPAQKDLAGGTVMCVFM